MTKFVKKNSILLLSILVVFTIIITILVTKYNNRPYIEKILTSRAYSYLPNEAKDYIRIVYSKTGELILTEKNKEENTPYLNPKFISYLELTDKEKKEVEVVPETYVIDYMENRNYEATDLPSTYDLMDENYTTPYYDQGDLGVCWSFASIEQAESYLMKVKKEPYSQSTEKFSVRQMDYATSQNGIKNYENENNFSRKLTEGGNFFTSSFIMSYGLSLVDENIIPYNENTELKSLPDVLNYDKSKYELNTSVFMPKLVSNAPDNIKEEYINLIKQYVINYGGAYTGTGSPQGNCGFENINGTHAIADDGVCIGTSGHAMQIIGWDDNYEYAYCNNNGIHTKVSANGTCSSGTKITGTGAWILRNSWGSNSSYRKVYLTYTPTDMDIAFTTSLSSMDTRNWDNLYHRNIWADSAVSSNSDTITYTKKIDTSEKIQAVKFYSSSMQAEYKISIKSANSNYSNIKTVQVSLPGIYKIDLSDQNIIINDPSYSVTITSTNSTKLLTSSISVYTSNIDKTPSIKTNDITPTSIIDKTDTSIKYLVYSDTKNIDSNDTVSYTITKDGVNYNNYLLSTEDNVVAENNINAVLEISKDIPPGDYKLNVIHNSSGAYQTNISIPEIFLLTGKGTEESPYLIHNEKELKQIVYDMEAYYKLENDITLTDPWIPIGTAQKPFKGGLDGDNHSINGLVINPNDDKSVGLFGYMKNQYYCEYDNDIKIYNKKAYIKNLKINNPKVTGMRDTGVLVGTMLFDYSEQPESARNHKNSEVTIDSISITGGTSTSIEGDAGMLIGRVNITPLGYLTPRVIMNNIYTSTTVKGITSSGLIGFINDSYISGSDIKLKIEISNFENIGKIIVPDNIEFSTDDFYSPVVGGLYGNLEIDLNNYIINSIFTDPTYNHYFLRFNNSYVLGNAIENTSYDENISKGYYVSKAANDLFTKNAKQIKDISLYASWEDFATYWKQVEGRIPQLKLSTIQYTDINDITVNKYDDISLLEEINGENDIQYVTYEEVSNDNIIEVYNRIENRVYKDIRINALEKGEAVLHVINNYDGMEKDITITVNSPKQSNPIITYCSNDSNNSTFEEVLTANQSFSTATNSFDRPGYRFVGWNTKKDGSGTSYNENQLIEEGIDENLRLYAQWEERSYTIKYHSNGGEGTMDDYTGIRLIPNNTYLLGENAFTRNNYIFVGWNTSPDGSGVSFVNRNEINNTHIPLFENDILNLYAQWSNIKYSLSFNANGGEGTMTTIEINSGLQTTLPENTFTKKGYKFAGWNTSSDGSGTSYDDKGKIIIEENTTLYATWTPITYTIQFISNEENRLIETQVFTYDQTSKLRKNTFINGEYDFAGWNTKRDGSGISYTDEQEILNITDKDNDVIDLFAQWREKIEYEIEYPFDNNKKIIKGITVGTTLNDFKNKISLGTGYTINVDTKTVNGKQLLYTGGKTRIYKNNELVVTFENAITGDSSGDGAINSMDLLKVVRYLKRLDDFTDYQFAAADCNNDNKINSMDLLKLVKYLKGLENI